MSCAPDPVVTASSASQKKASSGFIAFLKSIWFVPVAAVFVAVLLLVMQHVVHLSEAWNKFVNSLVYSTFIGLSSSLLLNFIGHRYTNRFPRLIWLMSIVALLATATFGTFAGAFVLQITGFIPHGYYWREIQTSLPITVVITQAFGLSIAAYETMRHKLQSATLELRTRQVEHERANKLLVEARLSSLESRIHPHFLFNTLNSIASLIPSDPKRAEDTVGKLASLLRFSLNSNHSSLVPLAQEVKIVRQYLEIESTRFGPRLRYQISVPDTLGSMKVPPLALQTLVENSLKHVVAQRTEGASIQITGSTQNGQLRLEVVDDGPGFSLAAVSPEHGLGNLVARLQLLFEDRGHLDVTREGAKTVARLTLPAET
jgi:two-component system, LytTR family, sensor histidine kinase AlgZ